MKRTKTSGQSKLHIFTIAFGVTAILALGITERVHAVNTEITTVYNNEYLTALSNAALDAFIIPFDEVWQVLNGPAIATAKAKNAFFSQTFGFYTDIGTGSTQTTLFTIVDAGDIGTSAMFNPTVPFGFFDDPSGATIKFSESVLNPGGFDNMIALIAPAAFPNSFILGWEDSEPGEFDTDFNDLIVRIDNAAPVPEPSTLVLLAIGFAGLVMYTRYREQMNGKGQSLKANS